MTIDGLLCQIISFMKTTLFGFCSLLPIATSTVLAHSVYSVDIYGVNFSMAHNDKEIHGYPWVFIEMFSWGSSFH